MSGLNFLPLLFDGYGTDSPRVDYASDMNAALINGECVEVLSAFPDECVDCCITSPPYWGQRDYGTAEWEGGDSDCSHFPPEEWLRSQFTDGSGIFSKTGATQRAAGIIRWYCPDGSCPECGAKRVDCQIGHENTPEEYAEALVRVFREVRRVLKKGGTLWLNLGDAYWGGGNYRGRNKETLSDKQRSMGGAHGMDTSVLSTTCRVPKGNAKRKDLVGAPWIVAFALREDGWWLRQDIIWHKTNAKPESVKDRCTKAHEYLFLFAKSRKYYYDYEAVREEADTGGTRNRRSVWPVPTQPYSEAHFAVFPSALIEPCVLAGCPEGGVVLDPFSGSAVTGAVSVEHGRKFLGIELNEEYHNLSIERLSEVSVGEKNGG